MGLVGRLRFNAENNNSPWVYYRVKSNDEDEKTLWHDWQIEDAKHFDTLNDKIKIMLSLLFLANITINEKGYTYLKNYCNNKNTCIDLNDYNSYYNFINDGISNFKFDVYAIKLEDAKLSDLTYIIEHFENPNFETENTPSKQNDEVFANHPKTMENTPNDDSTQGSYGESNLPSSAKLQDSSKILDSNINDPDYALRICELLVNQNLTRDAIFNELHSDMLSDPELAFEYQKDFFETVDQLEEGFVSEDKEGDIVYLKLNDDLKKISKD